MTVTAQRTMYGASLQLSMVLGKPYIVPANTTLNEKFNILPAEKLPDGAYPTVQFYAIGVGGQDVISGNEGYNYSKHSAVDAALFQHIPWIMRTLESDLNKDERTEYRMRTVEVFNGVKYACYYLRKIPDIEFRDYFYKVSTVNGDTSLSIYSTSTDKLLNPEAKVRTVNTTNINGSEYVTKTSKLKFSLAVSDMTELDTVLSIRGLATKKITEVGVCSGYDVTTDEISETICTQIAFHIEVNMNLAEHLSTDSIISRYIELGGMESLLT